MSQLPAFQLLNSIVSWPENCLQLVPASPSALLRYEDPVESCRWVFTWGSPGHMAEQTTAMAAAAGRLAKVCTGDFFPCWCPDPTQGFILEGDGVLPATAGSSISPVRIITAVAPLAENVPRLQLTNWRVTAAVLAEIGHTFTCVRWLRLDACHLDIDFWRGLPSLTTVETLVISSHTRLKIGQLVAFCRKVQRQAKIAFLNMDRTYMQGPIRDGFKSKWEECVRYRSAHGLVPVELCQWHYKKSRKSYGFHDGSDSDSYFDKRPVLYEADLF